MFTCVFTLSSYHCRRFHGYCHDLRCLRTDVAASKLPNSYDDVRCTGQVGKRKRGGHHGCVRAYSIRSSKIGKEGKQ